MNPSTAVRLRNPGSIYFGKIASRGDFVKSTSGGKVIALIDNWVAQGMEMLIAAPAWKTYYDNAGAIDFLFIATRKKHAISGCLIPSGDASSRRFPFIAATLFETDEALTFLPISPLALERHLSHQRALVHHASKTHDAADTLKKLDDMPFESKPVAANVVETYETFLVNTSTGALANALLLEDGYTSVRRLVLALGYLLQPILTSYATPPQKGIALPLPRDPSRISLVKALWLDLISVFLKRAEFELSVFSCIHYGKSKLIVTFNGTTPSAFHALFEEQAAQDHLIDVAQSAWVEDYVGQDPAIFKLSSYLEHGDLN
ncbi:MAG TPA: type VI secretion system-associated protein TagF, partial [Noviherbaspirillum sp.]|nr:type VI secretion system-associated protein TagF [Noviherbaspirillum sp.]